MAAALTNSATPTAAVMTMSSSEVEIQAKYTTVANSTHEHKSRLRKRAQLTLSEIYRNEMHSRDIEWANPCSGVWHEKTAQQQKERQHQRQNRNTGNRCLQYKKLLRKLKKITSNEFREFRKKAPLFPPMQMEPLAIDTRQTEMDTWALYNASYSFLPSLRAQSNIALRRWYREIQVFVAAFSFLRRAQLHWDYHHIMQESPATLELKQLKKSSRKMLCNIESIINQTSIINSRAKKRQQAMGTDIISRRSMEVRLRHFKTPIMQLYGETAPVRNFDNETSIALDIKFLKHFYVQYLNKLTNLLRSHVPKLCSKTSDKVAGAGTIETKRQQTNTNKTRQQKSQNKRMQ